MPAWLDHIMSPLNAAGESIQKLVEIRDTVKFGEAVGKLYAQILAAQQAALSAQARETTLLDEINDLKEQIRDLEAWEAEKERYELIALAPGVMACSVKEALRGNDPPHYICANCYNSGKKSYLQAITKGKYYDKYRCNGCGEELSINKGTPTVHHSPPRGGGPDAWMGR